MFLYAAWYIWGNLHHNGLLKLPTWPRASWPTHDVKAEFILDLGTSDWGILNIITITVFLLGCMVTVLFNHWGITSVKTITKKTWLSILNIEAKPFFCVSMSISFLANNSLLRLAPTNRLLSNSDTFKVISILFTVSTNIRNQLMSINMLETQEVNHNTEVRRVEDDCQKKRYRQGVLYSCNNLHAIVILCFFFFYLIRFGKK